MSRRIRTGAIEGTLLAGWLFADLLLALSVVFLGVVPGPTPRPTTTTTTTTTTTPHVERQGLDTNSVCLGEVDLSAQVEEQFSELNRMLSDANAKGRRVGFLIIVAGGPSPQPAFDLGLRLNDETGFSEISSEFYNDKGKKDDDWAYDSFHNISRPLNKATIKAWFYLKTGATEMKNAPGC